MYPYIMVNKMAKEKVHMKKPYTLKAARTDNEQYVNSGDTYYWKLQTFNNENSDSPEEMTNVRYERFIKNMPSTSLYLS